jgi:REP element-mobilizing transposase RayT
MAYIPDIHHRRSIRSQGYDYSRAGVYFITICTQNRESLFGDIVDGRMVLNHAGTMIQTVWNEIPFHNTGTEIDEFIVMPNHIHGIIVIGPFVRREAVLSSRIEGSQASLSDLFYFEAAPSEKAALSKKISSDVREVANYAKALEYTLKRIEELPLSLRLFRELHKILLSGGRGENWTPGEFRRSQNWIGPPGSTLMDATFVPPTPHEMMEALRCPFFLYFLM